MRAATIFALAQLLVAGLILAGAACGGEGSSCRSGDDCRGALECSGPNDPQVCGIPGTAECDADADCAADERCHAIDDPCSPDAVGSECRAPCSVGGCPEGFRCGGSGACETIPCDEGFACASHLACDPAAAQSGPVHERAHGCVVVACSSDDACTDVADGVGVCVNGSCQESPGSCVDVMLVP